MSDWIKIEQGAEMPELDEEAIIYPYPSEDCITASYCNKGWYIEHDEWRETLYFQPTHWMPLPEPPKE